MPPKHAHHGEGHGGGHGGGRGGGHGGHGGGHGGGGDHVAHGRSQDIHQHLEKLYQNGHLSNAQYNSIIAQLPKDGKKSDYEDPNHSGNAHHFNPSAIAHQAQDPKHPAHPKHPEHSSWAKNLAGKFGNAAVFGAGASAGGALFHSIV